MKLFKNLFLILTLTSVLVSCGNDDDAHVPTNSEKIIGNWELNQFMVNGNSVTTVGDEDPIEATIASIGETFTDAFSKFTHPSTTERSGSFLLVTTTTIGGQAVEKQEIIQFNTSGSWKIEGDKLTIKNGGEDEVYDIVELSDTILKLKRTTEETTTLGSTVVVVTLTSNLAFERQ